MKPSVANFDVVVLNLIDAMKADDVLPKSNLLSTNYT